MTMLYPRYRKPHEWVVLDTQTIYNFYDEPIKVVNVMIGTLHLYEKDVILKNYNRRTPITRWITQTTYNNYLKKEEL